MVYRRSLREIPLDENPHLSVLNALKATQAEENDYQTDWAQATEAQIKHVVMCPACNDVLGGLGRSSISDPEISTSVFLGLKGGA